jgi:hypothetical protein
MCMCMEVTRRSLLAAVMQPCAAVAATLASNQAGAQLDPHITAHKRHACATAAHTIKKDSTFSRHMQSQHTTRSKLHVAGSMRSC